MRVLAALSLLAAVALSGCASHDDLPPPRPENPNPFTYQHADFPFTVSFAPGATSPSAAEVSRLQSFLTTASARPGDTVRLSAEQTNLGRARIARLSDILARAGLLPATTIDLQPMPNTVGVMLDEVVVAEPHCGPWPVFAGEPSNEPAPFLGCALRNNLYQMVVDKRDLAVGRTPGPADAQPGMRAVQTYREGKAPSTGGDKDEKSGSKSGDSASGMTPTPSGAGGNSSGSGGQSGQGSDNGK
jgi:type IV pilus biogenesis protein CpaD/CtpE